jgi:asparagine synthase (glutamine-hydrolysing)
MCGIAGWLGPSQLQQAPMDTIRGMLARIAHRGPDGSGTAALTGDLGMFGHVRLAVIDPAGGVQPVWSQDRQSVLVFNGEIYNFRELRERLSGHGIAWRTHSDSEVLLELLLREGPSALSEVRGMYAFAFWDGPRQRAVLARDPAGIKPLFLRKAGATLWFASEAKAFPPTASWCPRLDAGQLHLLLNLRYPAGGAGLIGEVEQLAPGECLEWTDTGSRRWRIPAPSVHAIGLEDIRDAIMDSVRAHLVSDVPVASYLSGGIDSYIVSYAATCSDAGPLTSFTIQAGDDPNEAANAAESARWLGISNQPGALGKVDLDALTWLIWHLEVPKVNALQSAAVAQLAAKHVKVCLSGLGGDELFLGYRAHRHLARANSAARALGPLAGVIGAAASTVMPNVMGFGEFWRAANMLRCGQDAASTYALLRNVWDGALNHEHIYGPRMLDQKLPDAREWIRSRWSDGTDPVEAMADFEWSNKMVDDLLWQEDRTSMACGLEVRVPFVDERLRLALAPLRGLSAQRPGSKYLLKDAFKRDTPAKLLSRPKSGFQLDIASEIDRLFGHALDAWLSPALVRQHGLFNPTFVAHLLQLKRRRGHRWHFFLLLLMAQTHRWIDLFETGATPPPQAPALTREVA